MRTSQTITLAALVVTSGILGALAFGHGDVAPPARDASPVAVTRTYLDAAEWHDCDLTARLTTSHTTAWCGGLRGWAEGEPTLTGYGHVARHAVREGPPTADRTEECVATTVAQRGLVGPDRGTLPWEWCWVRTPDGWRLWDQGQG